LRDEGESETYCDMRSMWRREVSVVWGDIGAMMMCVGGVMWFAIEADALVWERGKKVGDGSVVWVG
jgi:hypothetical protein